MQYSRNERSMNKTAQDGCRLCWLLLGKPIPDEDTGVQSSDHDQDTSVANSELKAIETSSISDSGNIIEYLLAIEDKRDWKLKVTQRRANQPERACHFAISTPEGMNTIG